MLFVRVNQAFKTKRNNVVFPVNIITILFHLPILFAEKRLELQSMSSIKLKKKNNPKNNTQEIEHSQCKITDKEKQLDLDCQNNPKS